MSNDWFAASLMLVALGLALRMTLQLLAISNECSCCGTIMEDLGEQDRRPQLVEGNPPSLVCCCCWRRLIADCERRHFETGGRLPMPIVSDDVETECEVVA